MGCDIHMQAEVWNDEDACWEHVPDPIVTCTWCGGTGISKRGEPITLPSGLVVPPTTTTKAKPWTTTSTSPPRSTTSAKHTTTTTSATSTTSSTAHSTTCVAGARWGTRKERT